MVELEDIRDRQRKYIGQQGSLTLQIADLIERITQLEKEMAVLKATK